MATLGTYRLFALQLGTVLSMSGMRPTILEVGAGERIIDRGIVNVYRILGRLKDSPDQNN